MKKILIGLGICLVVLIIAGKFLPERNSGDKKISRPAAQKPKPRPAPPISAPEKYEPEPPSPLTLENKENIVVSSKPPALEKKEVSDTLPPLPSELMDEASDSDEEALLLKKKSEEIEKKKTS